MSTEPDFRSLLAAADGRRGLAPLLEALGLEASCESVPPAAWPAYGVADVPDLRGLAVVGRAGSLDAILVELASGAGPERRVHAARRIRSRNPARLHLYIMPDERYERLTLGVFGLDDSYRHLTVDRARPVASDLAALREMAPRNGESGLELVVRYDRALDRSQITRRFFVDFRARRDAVARAWLGVPEGATEERAQLALLFLSRLTFLYFLQRRGALSGRDRYLPELYGRWAGSRCREPGTFYRARLVPLFFGALNRRPAEREQAALRLGALPYLNGGLFERHALEQRFPELDLADPEVGSCFEDLLERYRFTGQESDGMGSGGSVHGVDPEILGRVFEGLMNRDQRGDTGSFYTPAAVVKRVVREAVATYVAGSCTDDEASAVVAGRGGTLPDATRYRVRERLQKVRVLDPACGSGAFLLGALERITVAVTGVSDRAAGDVRRDVVASSLHGVDLLDDAALLCSLRLWLALSRDDDEVGPLPNLDRRIRQGDALVDPLDLGWSDVGGETGLPWQPMHDPETRKALKAVEPAARKYLESSPEERRRLRQELQRVETRLARRWVDGARDATRRQLRGLHARAGDRDLFGERTNDARQAEAAAGRLRKRVQELERVATDLQEKGTLPFFSFGVHFADAAEGFDMIISNPPWVRSHRWPAHVRRLSGRYEVCRESGWREGSALTGAPGGAGAQVDLSLLFVERAVRLLAPGGVLAVLVPAKALRALYGGGARRMLLRDLDFALIEDHSLDQRSIFRADAFTAVFIGRRRRAAEPAVDGPLHVRLVRRGVDPLEYRVQQRDLPLFEGDDASPWLLAPPPAAAVLRRMQEAGPPLGRHEGLRVRRGIMTGANDPLLFTRVEPKLGGLAFVEAEGYEKAKRREGDVAAERYRGVVEMEGMRPLVRGADIDAFRYRAAGYVAWCHDDQAGPAEPPPRMRQYLEGHRELLEKRTGWRSGMPLGAVFRLSQETLRAKVVWHDLSDTLRAVALPAIVRINGQPRELIPLNTIYFLPTRDDRAAVLLAGLLNSLPVRTLARSVAERAKDARFRFFAWTISALPLPVAWSSARASEEIFRISDEAHREGGIDADCAARLDAAVARLYGLDPVDLDPLREFDAWLRGQATTHGTARTRASGADA